jgi:hypothetical protein
MAVYPSDLVLHVTPTIAGIGLSMTLWGRRRWFARRPLVPEAVVIHTDLAQRALDS